MEPRLPLDSTDDLTLEKIIAAWDQDGTLPVALEEVGGCPKVQEGFLPLEVTQSDLQHMSIKQLEGRLVYYAREAIFERDTKIRKENQIEARRTKEALDIKKAYLTAEAERVFE